MKFSISPAFRRWMRVIHRDLGYFVVGVSLIYGISGILLNHLGGKDPAYRVERQTMTAAASMTQQQLTDFWTQQGLPTVKRMMQSSGGYTLMLDGGIGAYSLHDGSITYEISHRRPFVYWINQLHYNRVKGWSVMADIFAGSLIFLALSGLFMTVGSKGIAGRGKWYLIIGLMVPVLYVLLS